MKTCKLIILRMQYLLYNISLNYNLLKCQEEIFLLMHSCKSSLASHDSGHQKILLADNDTQD